MDINITDIMILAGASQGFFLAVLLLLKREKRAINTPLIICIALLSLRLLNDFGYDTGLITHVVDWAYMLEPFNMGLGLCIFLYVRNMIERRALFYKRDWALMLPVIVYFIYYGFYFLKGHEYRLYDIQQYMIEGNGFIENSLEWFAESVVNSAFLVPTLLILRRYNRSVRENYSNTPALEFSSLRAIVGVLFGFYIVEAIISMFAVFGLSAPEFIYYIVYTGVIALLFSIGYNELIWSKPAADVSATKERYKNSSLSADSSKNLSAKLKSYMEQNKPYLDAEITLKSLSEMIEIQPHTLSQLINESFGCNFSEFINSYRVDEATRLLRDPQYKNYTLTAIGFEVGFNSKSAFYTAFKRFAGTTPAKY